MNDLISVIIPIYNVSEYLKECLDSILEQSYKNLEIILVDDGSTDGSSEICDEYQLKYSKIKVIHQKNKGLGLSRNTGLNQAHGKYVIFIDSDDYIGSNNIEHLYTEAISTNVDLVIGGYTQVDDSHRILFSKREQHRVYAQRDSVNGIMVRMLGNLPEGDDAIKPSVWNNLYSMNLIEKERLRFVSERELISEDIVWNTSYLAVAKAVSIIDDVDYFYRVNKRSLSRKFNSQRFELSTNFYKFMLRDILVLKLPQEAVLRTTKQYFINVYTCVSQLRHERLSFSYKKIAEYCRNETLQNAIINYPINRLRLKQRLFLKLMKNKYVLTLTILTKVI